MKQRKKTGWFCLMSTLVWSLIFISPLLAVENQKPLVLQEMTWTDVAEYLKTNDMVIIPIGSTEQHGPHLPLGTDFYESFGICKKISSEAGVVVAPIVMAGYSVYHDGFPGSLSLKPETLEQVLFETAEMLIKYGFKKFMFFNYHGGNRTAEQNVIHRINHQTSATALGIGIGSPVQKGKMPEPAPFDHHGGIGETSIMLYLNPELVKMDRAEKPKITLSPKYNQILALSQEYPALSAVLGTMLGVPRETGKGGASHEISSNGIWTMGDPKDATRERGEKTVQMYTKYAVEFINTWKQIKDK
ncbi:MAG: creatininase family protein [Deltaproteobacteria bacterium]|nr:creatininase family protein [Deltaproteobacteria bacterium]